MAIVKYGPRLMVASLLVLAACGKAEPKEDEVPAEEPGTTETPQPPAPPPPETTLQPIPSAAPLKGTFTALDGSTVDLATVSGKPTVVLFAQDSCTTCARETLRLKESLADGAPTNINLFTVLVGSVKEDAEEWHARHLPSWTVGYDPELALFLQYFAPGTQVPAVVVHHPEKGILQQQSATVTRADLEVLTGAWEVEP